jgi:hypothetical protein
MAVGSLVSASAAAQAPHGRHTHDGFFLRLSAGIGATTESALSLSSGVVTSQEAQPATVGDLALGGVIAPNLALHFSVFGSALNRRSAIVSSAGLAFSKQKTVTGIGGGTTYYFMPSNVYLSISVGGATMTVDYSDGVREEIPGGFAGFVGIGKEWWVSDNWGIGIAGQFAFARVSDAVGVWNTAWLGLAFSATYN